MCLPSGLVRRRRCMPALMQDCMPAAGRWGAFTCTRGASPAHLQHSQGIHSHTRDAHIQIEARDRKGRPCRRHPALLLSSFVHGGTYPGPCRSCKRLLPTATTTYTTNTRTSWFGCELCDLTCHPAFVTAAAVTAALACVPCQLHDCKYIIYIRVGAGPVVAQVDAVRLRDLPGPRHAGSSTNYSIMYVFLLLFQAKAGGKGFGYTTPGRCGHTCNHRTLSAAPCCSSRPPTTLTRPSRPGGVT